MNVKCCGVNADNVYYNKQKPQSVHNNKHYTFAFLCSINIQNQQRKTEYGRDKNERYSLLATDFVSYNWNIDIMQHNG